MKKLHSLAFYALVTPFVTLNAGSALAQQDATTATPGMTQGNSDNAAQGDKQSKMRTESQMGNRHYLDVTPANGLHGSKLIGAEVKTTDNEEVGEVKELIINERGQVEAILISVGGVLGMGEKDVAIPWDRITRSGGSDDLELRIDGTREDLRSAPSFKWRN